MKPEQRLHIIEAGVEQDRYSNTGEFLLEISNLLLEIMPPRWDYHKRQSFHLRAMSVFREYSELAIKESNRLDVIIDEVSAENRTLRKEIEELKSRLALP